MPYLSIEVGKANATTPRFTIFQRANNSNNELHKFVIGAKGIGTKGDKRLVSWKAVLRAIEDKAGANKDGIGNIVAKSLTLVTGAKLKKGNTKITYIQVWARIKKGAAHPLKIRITVGLTDKNVRFGRTNKDLDKADPIPFDDLKEELMKLVKRHRQLKRARQTSPIGKRRKSD